MNILEDGGARWPSLMWNPGGTPVEIQLDNSNNGFCYDALMKQLVTIFLSIFIAEIGDKTQLATLLFATDKNVSKTGVFFAAATALAASSLIAVIAGEALTRVISPSTLKIAAGIGFIVVGLWTLISSGS